MRLLVALLLLPLAGSLTPVLAGAQSVTLDEGTFAITLGGRDAGSETFTIRRVGMGAEVRVIAQGRVEIRLPQGSTAMEPVLEVTPSLSLAGYQNRITGAREEVFTLAGLSDRRFQGRTVSAMGEQVQEYRASSGTILAEDWVAHHYFLLGPRLDEGVTQVPVIVPGQGRQLQMNIAPAGNETVQIGGQGVEARRFDVEVGGATRRIWVDAQGRVLQVEESAAAYRAVRTSRP